MALSAKELAIELDTDARTVRKFLRDTTDPENHPGQGGRWNFEKKQVKGLKKKFEAWQTEKVKTNKPDPEEIEELTDDVDEELIDDLEDLGEDEEDEDLEIDTDEDDDDIEEL